MAALVIANGERLRLCARHDRERRAAGQEILVPFIDDVAIMFILADRPVPAFPCHDCKKEDA